MVHKQRKGKEMGGDLKVKEFTNLLFLRYGIIILKTYNDYIVLYNLTLAHKIMTTSYLIIQV